MDQAVSVNKNSVRCTQIHTHSLSHTRAANTRTAHAPASDFPHELSDDQILLSSGRLSVYTHILIAPLTGSKKALPQFISCLKRESSF